MNREVKRLDRSSLLGVLGEIKLGASEVSSLSKKSSLNGPKIIVVLSSILPLLQCGESFSFISVVAGAVISLFAYSKLWLNEKYEEIMF